MSVYRDIFLLCYVCIINIWTSHSNIVINQCEIVIRNKKKSNIRNNNNERKKTQQYIVFDFTHFLFLLLCGAFVLSMYWISLVLANVNKYV